MVIPFPDQLLIFPILRHLLPDLILLLLRQLSGIQFIAECPRHGHHPSGMEAHTAPGLMVRHRGHMGSHCGNRIEERSPILDPQPIHRIRVIAAPDLRRIVQHARVKPAASAAAALYQHIRISAPQFFQEIIYSHHIVICHHSGLILHGVNIRETPVHVPLHIGNVPLV